MEKRFDVFSMCNALFDIQAEVRDDVPASVGMPKGGMMLLTHEEQRAIVPQVYTEIVNTEAGGAGANTAIGVALLGGRACYTSRIGRDDHGRRYRAGLAAQGVQANLGEGDGDTGISLILVTPDAERTMGTYLGMAQDLRASDISADDLRASHYLYVTGYLWDTETQKEAVLYAMREAREAGVIVTLSLSDPFCVARHKGDFLHLLSNYVDVVFSNRDEALEITDTTDPDEAVRRLARMTGGGGRKGIAVVTLNKAGSLIAQGETVWAVPAYPVEAVDTTGAGDMYAAGMLYGLSRNLPLPVAGRIAAYTAAQVVARMGPRLPALDREAIRVIESAV